MRSLIASILLFTVVLFSGGCLEGGNISMGKATPEQKLNKVILGFSRREAITDLGSLRNFQKDLDVALKGAPLKIVPEINHFKAWSLFWEAWLLSNRKHQADGILENLRKAEKCFKRAIADNHSRELYLLGGMLYSEFIKYDKIERDKDYFYSKCCFYMANNSLDESQSLNRFNFGQHYFSTDEISVMSTYADFYSGHYSLALKRLESLDVDHYSPEYIMAHSYFCLMLGDYDEAVKYMEIFKSPRYRSFYLYRAALNQLRLCYEALNLRNPGDYSIDIKVVLNLLKEEQDFFTSKNLLEFSKDIYISAEKKALDDVFKVKTNDSNKKKILNDLLDKEKWPNNFLKIDVMEQPDVYRECLYQSALLGDDSSEIELKKKFPFDKYSFKAEIEDDSEDLYYFTGYFKEREKDKVPSFYIFAASGSDLPTEIKLEVSGNTYWLEPNKIMRFFKLSSFKIPEKDEKAVLSVFIKKKEIKISFNIPGQNHKDKK